MSAGSEHYRPIDDSRNRLVQQGSMVLAIPELLAIVLGTGAVGEAYSLAEHLIAAHGGLLGLVQTPLPELEAHHNMGKHKAMQIKAALELGSRINIERMGIRPQIRTPADAAALLMADMGTLEQEEVRTLLLDARNRVISSHMIYRGTLNSANMRVAEIFREAIRRNAASILLAHNHPSGDPSPSQDDLFVTREVVRAGKILDIDVVDHLVLGFNTFVSLKERGVDFDWSIRSS